MLFASWIKLTFKFVFIEWCYLPNYESVDSLVKPTYELLRAKEAHTKGVKCIAVWRTNSNHLKPSISKSSIWRDYLLVVTGGYDGKIKIWGYNNLEYITTLTCHSDAVWDIKTFGNLLASCGTDGKVALIENAPNPDSTKTENRQDEQNSKIHRW